MGTVRGVTIGPITAIHQNPPALDVADGAFLVAHPALLSGLKLEDRVTVVWHGEGRAFGRKAHLLPGVTSTRLYLKRLNHDAQIALERNRDLLAAREGRRGCHSHRGHA